MYYPYMNNIVTNELIACIYQRKERNKRIKRERKFTMIFQNTTEYRIYPKREAKFVAENTPNKKFRVHVNYTELQRKCIYEYLV